MGPLSKALGPRVPTGTDCVSSSDCVSSFVCFFGKKQLPINKMQIKFIIIDDIVLLPGMGLGSPATLGKKNGKRLHVWMNVL